MPPQTLNKDRSTLDSNGSSPNPGPSTRPNTRRTGPPAIIEEQQDIRDAQDGRKFLEKCSLLCPPGEPPTHQSLATCLHQISAMAGVPKQTVNAIRAVAFLLGEIEDTQINTSLREALDSQMTEFTSDFKILIEDMKEKIDEHAKIAEAHLVKIAPIAPTAGRPTTTSYASVLVNPPAHANPKIAAREGIKARQFLIQGINESKFSHLNVIQLKDEFNKILTELGLSTGKIRAAVKSRSGGTVIEADSDETANWLSNSSNQKKLCEKLDTKAEFKVRSYNVIAFNVPLAINPEEMEHRLEICEANGIEPSTIQSAKWAKAINKRTTVQKTAHLLLTFDSAHAANRAITNGLYVCNRKCQVERTRREPIRCLKCQGWNHFAKDCLEEKDTCGNCAGSHRTSDCQSSDRACASCKVKDHASWSRACPAFIKRAAEFNARNPDNSLQYFPTADVWTWYTVDKASPATSAAPPTSTPAIPQMFPNRSQPNNKARHNKRRHDTYIPDDTYLPADTYVSTDVYIPDNIRRAAFPEPNEPTTWNEDTWSNNPRQHGRTNQPSQRVTSTQSPGQGASDSNSTANPYTSNG